MQSFWKIKLWAKFVNHFDVLTIYEAEKSQCGRRACSINENKKDDNNFQVSFTFLLKVLL